MKITIACNAFKESMSSIRAAEAVEAGFRAALGSVSVTRVAIADGGDGTLDAVAASVKHRRIRLPVEDPLGRPIEAEYLLVDGGRTAVVEMALASGLALLKMSERNPLKTGTRGAGLLIRDALDRGVDKVIVGIGGSATNDGGVGFAHALGYVFLDKRGKEVPPKGGDLRRIATISTDNVHPAVGKAAFLVASDVTNPLLGPTGATAVYGPQKGATPDKIKILEEGLEKLAEAVERDLGVTKRNAPGAGAAGGSGYGLMVFTGAKLRPGIELLAEISGLAEKVSESDLVVTGEGRMDSQSVQGKAPFGVLKIAKKHRVPAVAFCGSIDGDRALVKAGFAAVIPIVDAPMQLEEAISRGPELLEKAAFRTGLIIKMGKLIDCSKMS